MNCYPLYCHILVVSGAQGADKDPETPALSELLFQAVFVKRRYQERVSFAGRPMPPTGMIRKGWGPVAATFGVKALVVFLLLTICNVNLMG